MMRVYRDELVLARPPRLVQALLFGVLAPMGRLFGYTGEYPLMRGMALPIATDLIKLLVANCRTSDVLPDALLYALGTWERERLVTRIDLHPLAIADVEALVRAMPPPQ